MSTNEDQTLDAAPVEAVEQVEQPESAAATNAWYSEDYQDIVESKGFSTPDDVLKSYKNLEQLKGSMVKVPSSEDSEEAWNAYYAKIGRPEDPSGYQLDGYINENFSSVPISGIKEELNVFESEAHKIGLTQEQATHLTNMRLEALTAQAQQSSEAFKSNQAAIRQSWGNNYEKNLSLADKAAEALKSKDPNSFQALKGQMQDNPLFLDLLVDYGKSLQESPTELGTADYISPDEAASEIAALRADPIFMSKLNNPADPGNVAAKAKFDRLYRLKNSGR